MTTSKKIVCPKCGATIKTPRLGRKCYPIPLAKVCKAFRMGNSNMSRAAEILTKQFGIKVTPAFVSARLKRAGLRPEWKTNGTNR